MKKLVSIIAFLFASAVNAQEPPVVQFTPQEVTELVRIQTARIEVSAQLRNLSDAITHSQTELTRPLFYQTALRGIEASYDCHLAIRYFLNSAPEFDQFAAEPPFNTLTRDQTVALGVQSVADCNADTASFASQLISTGQAALANPKPGDPLSDNQANIIIAGGQRLQNPNVISLGSFNESLTYLNWQPRDYPRVIGPHGDYNFAQRGVDHADLKWLEMLKDVTLFYGNAVNWNDKANVGYREMLAYGSDALGLFARVWYINAGMVTRFPDQQAIDADFVFSSGLRPKSFFAILRAFELVNSPDPHELGLGGRNLAAGITGQFAVVLDQMGEMEQGYAQNNSLADINSALNMSGGQTSFVSAVSSVGKLREAFVDLAQAWLNLETFNTGEFLFFRAPQPPPGGGSCPQGQVCQVPTSCGPGTELVGSQCLPLPAPECPDQVVVFQSISSTGQVVAVCAEQP